MLEMESLEHQEAYLKNWATTTKAYVDKKLVHFVKERPGCVPFDVPNDLMLISPLAISSASGEQLSAFREVMNYENLCMSFSKTGQYEAAGTVWMLDPAPQSGSDSISVAQLEASMGLWSQDAFMMSSTEPLQRRFTFDVPLPADVVDVNVAQRKTPTGSSVLMAHPLPMLAGRALVIGWYEQVLRAIQAFEAGDADAEIRVLKLFEAALSVPIRLRRTPSDDARRLMALAFSESMCLTSAASGADSFWKFAEQASQLSGFLHGIDENLSLPKLFAEIRKYGLTFKGKALLEASVKGLKSLTPFVPDAQCGAAYALMEAFCPELREPTLLMRIAQLVSGKSADFAAARASLVFIFDSLRVARLTGDSPKGEVYTVAKLTGQEKKTPAMVHLLFKKQSLIEFLTHEVELINKPLLNATRMFRTPLALMKHFSASGEQGIVAKFRDDDADPEQGMESLFAISVADYRDQEIHNATEQALIDLMWGCWNGTFDDELTDLCTKDTTTQAGVTNFLWHRYLQDCENEMGSKYRAFVAISQGGPISTDVAAPSFVGTTEFSDDVKEEIREVQKLLMKLRRDTVTFVQLPTIGGASGAEYSKVQMEKMWNDMRLGHRFARKKGDVRAFILSADLFPPNVTKHGVVTSLSEPIAVDEERMRRVLDFIIQKRTKDDLILLFDGRSKPCRKVMEEVEDKLRASGGHFVTEFWTVFLAPSKKEDPRVPARQTSFASNNKEAIICAFPSTSRSTTKVLQRSEFNVCGESSTSATSYTGVPMRRFCELPRLSTDSKSAILGVAASGAVKKKRIQSDIDEKGHPFSHCETKPLNMWQRICEHNHVTHIVDFSAGSAALAIAVAGSISYEGVAANDVHFEWLDSTMDRCLMYLASQDKDLTKKLGGDAEFMEKLVKYFWGTMMEARQLLEPPSDEEEEDDDSDDDPESGDEAA